MVLSTQNKINKLIAFQKSDVSIQNEYNEVMKGYQQAKACYKSSKDDCNNARKELERAQEYLSKAPLYKIFSANKKMKIAQKNLKSKKQKLQADKDFYKKKLFELRRLRSEIREQYKTHKDYVKFFKRVQEAKKMGIEIPRYITKEYDRQKNLYLSEKYKIDKYGKKTYMTPSNNICSKDIATLIFEKNKQDVKDKVKDITIKAKDHIIPDIDGR